MIDPTMGLLDSIRRLFGHAENAMNEVDYAALDAVHHAEDRVDEATHGRYYDAVEKADEEAGELLERLHLDGEPGQGRDATGDAGDPEPGSGPAAA
jgi:hypothetical protein